MVAQAFGMKTVGFKKSIDAAIPSFDRLTNNVSEALASADVIVNCLPNTPYTAGLLSGDMLSVCQARKPVFLNCGR